MIAVLADDLTGAAEIAGIAGRRCGSVEIRDWRRLEAPFAEVVVWNTASRLLSPVAAVHPVLAVGRSLAHLGPGCVFKKVDSVLRGNVGHELRAMVAVLRADGALLIPANPSRGRTISQGRYLIDGVPLHKTGFRRDPTHPRLSSDVASLLARLDVEPLPESGPIGGSGNGSIWIGDAETIAQIRAHERRRSDRCLAAGGADFFEAWFARKSITIPASRGKGPPARFAERHLMVCGSRSVASREFLQQAVPEGWVVGRMPRSLAKAKPSDEPEELRRWLARMFSAGADDRRLVMAIGAHRGVDSAILSRRLTLAADAFIDLWKPAMIGVEGGSTAEGLLRRRGVECLELVHEFAPGVVSLRARVDQDVRWILKPGSYRWPDKLVASSHR